MLSIKFLEDLEYSWTARILQNNDIECVIWYTCLPSCKHIIKQVLNVSSDYPKHKISK